MTSRAAVFRLEFIDVTGPGIGRERAQHAIKAMTRSVLSEKIPVVSFK
jgi:hypothetical protein